MESPSNSAPKSWDDELNGWVATGWATSKCCKIRATSSRATSRQERPWRTEEPRCVLSLEATNETKNLTFFGVKRWNPNRSTLFPVFSQEVRPSKRRGRRTTGVEFKLALLVSKPQRIDFVTADPRTNCFLRAEKLSKGYPFSERS